MSYVEDIQDGVLRRCIGAPDEKLKISTSATVIGSNAFFGKNNLKEVRLHDSVTEIGSNAFYGCGNLTKINFPEGLREIGSSAFRECGNLAKINFPEGLREIGARAFMFCRKLRDVHLPSSLEKIGARAFTGTAWLKEATESVYAGGFLLRAMPQNGEFAIAPGTRSVMGGAFEGCADLKKLTIPESVTFLGDSLFCASGMGAPDWDALEEIVIPESVTYIGADAFSGCTALRRIEISEETVKRLGQHMIERAFFGAHLTSFWYTGSDYCAAYRKSLPLRVLLGENIELGALREPLDAFLRKKSTRTELFPFLIANDMPQALAAALSVQKKLPLDELETYLSFAEKSQSAELKATLLEYQNSKYSAAEKAKKAQDDEDKALGMKEPSLADWRKVFKVGVKDGKATISAYVGKEPEATIPETVGKYTVTEIKEKAFCGNSTLTLLDIHAQIKTIPQKAFERSRLVSLKMPDSVRTIGAAAFSCCADLEAIRFSKKLRTIESCAFQSCGSLTSLSLPKGMKTIQFKAFYNCCALKRIDLPDTVTEIDDCAFAFCDDLTIHAPAGSFAEQYAKNHDIPFEAERQEEKA